MNRVNLVGRWTKDIELRYLNDGTPVGTGTIAVDEGFGDKKKSYFFTVVMWRKTAEAASQYSGKGKRVAIDGRLTQRSYEKEGNKVFVVEVVADQVEFLESKESGNRQNQNDLPEPPPIDDSDIPF